MSDMNQSSCTPKREKSEDRVSRAHSQDALDSSSASSLSFFADHSDTQNSGCQANERNVDDQKSGECSPSKVPMDEALKSEKAFIEFVMSLPPKDNSEQHHRSTDSVIPKSKSPAASGNATKVGLDHLDNLCKLMEQLSDLRETNNKLQRRVQYLEDLKILHDMHKEINEEVQYSSEDALTAKPRAYELKKSATESCCPKKEEIPALHSYRNSSKYQSRRSRAQSTDVQRRERSKSVGHDDSVEDTKTKRIFPKWSKVKEAFGWESERKDSVKVKCDSDTGSMRSPRRSSDYSRQCYHHANSPTWSHASLHSSLEDIHEIFDAGRWKRASIVSEKNVLHLDTPKEVLRRQKSTPSPGSEKIMAFREATDLKPKSSTIERDTYSHQDFKDDGKRGKSPWGRVKTIIERRRDSLKRRSLRREHICVECDSIPPKKDIETKSYTEYLDSTAAKQPVLSDSYKHKQFSPEPIIIDQEVDYSGPRTPSSSPTFQRKSRWTRVKKALKGKKEDEKDPSLSTPASPTSVQDDHFTFDAIEEISQDSFEEGREIKRVGSDSHVHQMVLSEPTCDLMLQLQRNLSEDFHRKIMEWERMRSSGTSSCSPHWDRKPSLTIRSRKKSERDDKNIKPKLKDLTWLEKELQKIEKEKQRLSKERQKYEERALRLEKLKETVLNAKNSNKREVFVRTSAGEFRFEGISDAFTKKLYEWETKRGLGPELSTIALLDSSRPTVQQNIGPKSGPLQRVVSRSESSVAEIGQPSHNSSNSLPSLKVPDTIETERANQPSRANSEPDLSTLVALTNGANVSVSNLSRQVGDSLDDEITASPGVSRESEEDELDKKRNDSETYYGLLEENVILLEQLKDKEEICRRLENELDVLDKKVDVMNKHHTQETERYREKLWEMHKPGATPRDVQCCLRTMAQLRKRIEVLEKCTEKLRNDRDSIQDSFRYHSKQQEDMTLDLLQKMSELQAAGSSTECETKENIPPGMNVSVMERLQDLSALLVKQTQELQETLAAKTRQISQLRWELLHRDLSTVKLETELHTHTAHRKRSKYAHYRSHSSEEAPAVSLSEELDHGKSALITEAYYNSSVPESEFQATQLTNTVQQLSRELLKLANAAEYPPEDEENAEPYEKRKSSEESWINTEWQPKNRDKPKQITVRRNSADNISVVSEKDERFKQNVSSSVDSDDSSDDGYTKISFHSYRRNNFGLHPNAERLLMSSGEYPPRGYLQRRKKLQKSVKGSSSPNRRRSNTFHNKRDFEKPIMLENIPQKCHSFRYPTEKSVNQSRSRNTSDTINIQSLLGEVRYREFLKRRAQMCRNNHGQTAVTTNKSSRNVIVDSKAKCQWLREVASDSKIPLLFQVQYRADESARSKHDGKCPVRSMSDKQKRETAEERREIFQKNSRKQLTSPDLFSYLNEKSNRINYSNQRESKGDPVTKAHFRDLPTKSENKEKNSSESQTNIPSLNAGTSVMVQLPRRKSKKLQIKLTKDNTITEKSPIFVPQKRSLSSEKEFENSIKENSNIKASENYNQQTISNRTENSTRRSFTDSQLYKEKNATRDIKGYNETGPVTNEKHDMLSYEARTENEALQNEQMSRKRKADDCDTTHKDPTLCDIQITSIQNDHIHNIKSNTIDSSVNDRCSFISSPTGDCMKSPSAPHLDWRKMCAKKISREDTSTVRSLIEKYNRVAENQSVRNPLSNSSLTSNRKISSPLFNSKSDHTILSHSFSTPTTPSIVPASAFYNPLVFKPVDLDLFSKSPPASPDSMARNEAIKKAKEQFISSQSITQSFPQKRQNNDQTLTYSSAVDGDISDNRTLTPLITVSAHDTKIKKPDDDRISNCSMDSMSYVMFRTGETCQESRLSKRSVDYSKTDSDTLERNKLKPSKSLSNSSIFKTVLSSDFKISASLMKLKRSKRKKDMATVSQLCRQSLVLSTEDTEKVSAQSSHKSCPSSPELKSKNEVKPSWFHRNILRHK